MSEHEWTTDSPESGDLERSMTPADHVEYGSDAPEVSEPPAEEAAPAPVESRPRFRGMPVNLAAISIAKFRRRPKLKGDEASTDVETSPPAPSGRFARLKGLDWRRFPLANSRRETRVGVAALLSFVVLVSVMILNRNPGTAKKSPSLALNTPVADAVKNVKPDEIPKELDPTPIKKPDRKKRVPPDPPTGLAEPIKPPDLDRGEDIRLVANDSPPSPTEPLAPPKTDPVPPAKVDPPATAKPDPVAPPKVEPVEATAKPDPVAPPSLDPAAPKPEPVLPEPTAPKSEPVKPEPAAPKPGPKVEPTPKPESMPPAKPDPAPAPAVIEPKPEPTLPTFPADEPMPTKASDLPPLGTEPKLPDPASPKPAEAAVAKPKPLAPPTPDPQPTPPPTPAPKPEPRPAVPVMEPDPKQAPAPAKELNVKPLEPIPSLAPAVEPVEPNPMPVTAPPAPSDPIPEATPVPSNRMPAFDKAPTPIGADPAPAPAATDVPTIRNLGKRRPAEPEIESQPRPTAPIADAPMPREAVGARERVEPILHTVRSGENFWTISKLYYESGRYYKSLHSANRKLVPDIRELYVGTTIKIPPIEDLDPTLIDAPSRSGSGTSRTAATSRRNVEPRAARPKPLDDAEGGLPTLGASRVRDRERTEDIEEPAQPTYKVRQYDTLRSIARDTLGDARRYREILELNRDVIDDPVHLTTGQKLNLPDDATVGRRMR
jgi:nucleoid-associated protein YgaU